MKIITKDEMQALPLIKRVGTLTVTGMDDEALNNMLRILSDASKELLAGKPLITVCAKAAEEMNAMLSGDVDYSADVIILLTHTLSPKDEVIMLNELMELSNHVNRNVVRGYETVKQHLPTLTSVAM